MPDRAPPCSDSAKAEVPPWQCRQRAQRVMVTTVNGDVVELARGTVTRRGRFGDVAWQARLPGLAGCRGGSLAVGYHDEIRVACDGGLQALHGSGERDWLLSFPGQGASQPWLDGSGATFLGVGNRFLAIDSQGDVVWSVTVPGDREVFAPALDPKGAFLFVAAAAEREIVTPQHVFYLPEPDALLYRVAATGKVLDTYPTERRPGGKWPAHAKVGADTGYRIPSPNQPNLNGRNLFEHYGGYNGR